MWINRVCENHIVPEQGCLGCERMERLYQERNSGLKRRYRRAWYINHSESENIRMKGYQRKNPDIINRARKLATDRLRLRVLRVLGGICVLCHVDDPRILNINHLNGNGRIDIKSRPAKLYRDIVNGTRPRDEFDVRCCNHNIIYEYEAGRRRWFGVDEPRPHGANPDAWRFYYQTKREDLLRFLGSQCAVCKEADMRILTVNHLKGGGTKAMYAASNVRAYYRDIIDGVAPKEELDVRCMNHNILYEYETGRRTWLLPTTTNNLIKTRGDEVEE